MFSFYLYFVVGVFLCIYSLQIVCVCVGVLFFLSILRDANPFIPNALPQDVCCLRHFLLTVRLEERFANQKRSG